MTFSARVKRAVSQRPEQRTCCAKAQFYGALLFCGGFSKAGVTVTTEHEEYARWLCAQLEHFCRIVTACRPILRRGRKLWEVTVQKAEDLEKLFAFLPQSARSAISLRVDGEFIKKECCQKAFLRGAFLSCGSISDPQKDYHLEFATSHLLLSEDLSALLRRFHLDPKRTIRQNRYVIYLKRSEQLEDFLNLIGVTSLALELMELKVMREVRNHINRTVNFEAANITKTAEAALSQRRAIEKIAAARGLESLPEGLREVARIRLLEEGLSLAELGARLSPPISRSGVNHRLQKLIDLAKEL